MIFHTRTPTTTCTCTRCKAQGTEGSFIGTQSRHGGRVTWYCQACWSHLQTMLAAFRRPQQAWRARRA